MYVLLQKKLTPNQNHFLTSHRFSFVSQMLSYVEVSWPYAQLLQGKESTETKTRSKQWSQWDHWLRNILYYSSNTKGNSSPVFCYLEFLQPWLMVIKRRGHKEAWDKCGPKKKEHLHSRSVFFMNCSQPQCVQKGLLLAWSLQCSVALPTGQSDE